MVGHRPLDKNALVLRALLEPVYFAKKRARALQSCAFTVWRCRRVQRMERRKLNYYGQGLHRRSSAGGPKKFRKICAIRWWQLASHSVVYAKRNVYDARFLLNHTHTTQWEYNIKIMIFRGGWICIDDFGEQHISQLMRVFAAYFDKKSRVSSFLVYFYCLSRENDFWILYICMYIYI